MRYVFTFLCVYAPSTMGCSETVGIGGGGVPCEDDFECVDDNNACTEDYCDAGFCRYEPIECDADFSDCTVEMCDPAVGCEQTRIADGTTCAGGTCQAGICELADSVLPCTEQGIRNAIATGGDEPYTFDCDGMTQIVTQAAIVINNNVILDGGGNLTVTGSPNPLFIVEEEATAGLRRFTMTGGSALPLPSEKIGEFPTVGGISNGGTLTLTNSTVSNKPGSGISNGGTLTLTNCTVSGNRGDLLAGGIDNGGTLTLTNSTVSGNSGLVGGILNNGTLTMTSSTLSGNITYDPQDETSGIVNGEEATLTVANSLVDGDCSNEGIITSNGYNIESPADTCGFDIDKGDQINVPDPKLGPLQNNDGSTETHALLPGSVAIDVIPEAMCEVDTDQRGKPRRVGVDSKCDVGSFEVQP